VIVETEAYGGFTDSASHAFKGITKRNLAMFGQEGRAYIYFIYGSHHCLNLVTKNEGEVGAVLIRAIEPAVGVDIMRKNRNVNELTSLTNGPGKLCDALAINLTLDKVDVTLPSSPIMISSRAGPERKVASSPRVGITSAIRRKWRFYDSDSEFVSRARLIYP